MLNYQVIGQVLRPNNKDFLLKVLGVQHTKKLIVKFMNINFLAILRSVYIDQKLLLCNSRVRIQEVKFHPGSPTNSHLVVLTSDNCIRYVRQSDRHF